MTIEVSRKVILFIVFLVTFLVLTFCSGGMGQEGDTISPGLFIFVLAWIMSGLGLLVFGVMAVITWLEDDEPVSITFGRRDE